VNPTPLEPGAGKDLIDGLPEAPTSPVTGVLSNTGCSVNVKQLTEITAGFWYNFYKGPMGRFTAGAQFEYIHRDAFGGMLSPGVSRLRRIRQSC
jgi:hypothetical protein